MGLGKANCRSENKKKQDYIGVYIPKQTYVGVCESCRSKADIYIRVLRVSGGLQECNLRVLVVPLQKEALRDEGVCRLLRPPAFFLHAFFFAEGRSICILLQTPALQKEGVCAPVVACGNAICVLYTSAFAHICVYHVCVSSHMCPIYMCVRTRTCV